MAVKIPAVFPMLPITNELECVGVIMYARLDICPVIAGNILLFHGSSLYYALIV